MWSILMMFININKNKFNNPTKSNNFEAFLKFIDELILKKSVPEDVIILNRNDFENDETFEKAKKLLDKNKFTPSEIFKTSKINSYKNSYF